MSVENRKVFISYSWTSNEHVNWVVTLAERLVSDGVDVILDKWNLSPGQDKFKFMESMVTDDQMNKVLIICDSGYKSKADTREGGVGTEAQIITPELYGEVNQNKFIPIIVEKGDEFDSYMPAFVKSRIAIDMSSLERMEEGYRQLIRTIFDKPLFQKPALGTPPKSLLEDKKVQTKSALLLNQIESTFLKTPPKPQYYVRGFKENFLKELESFVIEELDTPRDQCILDKITEMCPLRDSYVKFLKLYTSSLEFKIETIQEMLEEASKYTIRMKSGSYYEDQYDNIKFFLYEIFIYTCVILIENNMFMDLSILLSSVYFVETIYGNKELDFTYFRFYIASLDEIRNRRLELGRLSVTADTFLSRSNIEGISYREKFIQADLLLFHIAAVKEIEWFPVTYPFFKGQLDLLRRLVSKRHCKKLLTLFEVDSIESLKSKLESTQMPFSGYNRGFERLEPITYHIEVEKIGSKP